MQKKDGKIFLEFFIFVQKIWSQNQKRKMQNDNYFTQWARGVQMEKRGVNSKTDSGPAQASHLLPPASVKRALPCSKYKLLIL